MRFLGLGFADKIPDAKTVWLFREHLKEAKLIEALFARFHSQLAACGYIAKAGQMPKLVKCQSWTNAKAGQMIDATFVEVPRQRNNREENSQIKAGETPSQWKKEENKSMLRQKDVDARWVKKNEENYYGYKSHINADQAHKLIHAYKVTAASLHDSQVFEELLDHTINPETGKKRDAFADSAYRSEEKEMLLITLNIESQICEKGSRNNPLTAEQKLSNTKKSKVRSRVEHIFGAQAHMGKHFTRTIGLLRAEVKIGMMNLTYNMVRLGQLLKRDGIVASTVT
jgi:IS5 family transposase